MLRFIKKIVSPFSRIKSALGQKIRGLFSKGKDEAAYEELERLLYEADLGAELAAQLVEEVRKQPAEKPEEILAFVKKRILSFFSPLAPLSLRSPHVVLIVGVNGSGKTTSLAKLASKYHAEGKKVLVGAADTFRAAAIEQLDLWAHKIGVEIVKGQPKSDPSAVAYDAIAAGLA